MLVSAQGGHPLCVAPVQEGRGRGDLPDHRHEVCRTLDEIPQLLGARLAAALGEVGRDRDRGDAHEGEGGEDDADDHEGVHGVLRVVGDLVRGCQASPSSQHDTEIVRTAWRVTIQKTLTVFLRKSGPIPLGYGDSVESLSGPFVVGHREVLLEVSLPDEL